MRRPDLLLAAFPPEFANFAEHPPAGWVLACTGVGSIAAAAATARLLAEHRPGRVLFLGTCGAYDHRLSPGDLISAGDVLAVSLEELEGRAYRPEIEIRRWAPGYPLPFPPHGVAVPPAITRTTEGAARLAAVASAEHLELAGVFEACRAAAVPAASALAVANRVGPEAHAQWKARHAQASGDLAAALRRSGILG